MNTEELKSRLEKEKAELEAELSHVARKNPDNLSDWDPIPAESESSQADENILADSIEEYEDNIAITSSLESRYKDVLSGLDKIKHGTYGKCQICDKEIESDRLQANPAARTCKEHINAI